MKAVSRKKELIDNLVKTEIVKTVLTLIKKDQPVTMDKVAKHCGLAKGSLYNYFKNKDDLLNYVHQTVLGPIRETNKEILESTGDPVVRLHAFIDAVFGIHQDVSIYFRFIQRKRTVADEIRERMDLIIRPLAKLCTQGIESGSFMDVNPYILAEMIYGTVIGPLKSIQYSYLENTHMEEIKQDVVCLVDRIILK